MSILEKIVSEATALGWIDWVATITALVYVVLAARDNIWCWFWGIISCSLWAYASFIFYDLWLDALLQLFYVGMGVLGIYQWRAGNKEQKEKPISILSWKQHGIILITGTITALIFGHFFDEYTDAASTYLDAFTTIFAVFATFILVQKKLENWIYWVIIDALYVYLYASRGAYLFAALMVLYVIIAALAFFNWRNIYRTQTTSQSRKLKF